MNLKNMHYVFYENIKTASITLLNTACDGNPRKYLHDDKKSLKNSKIGVKITYWYIEHNSIPPEIYSALCPFTTLALCSTRNLLKLLVSKAFPVFSLHLS